MWALEVIVTSEAHFEIKPFEGSGIDREYLYQLYKKLLKSHVEAAFGWRELEQRNRFEESYPSREVSLIFMATKVVGYLAVRNSSACKHVALLLIEPAFQGGGIGGNIMRGLHADALQLSQKVMLSCFKSNTVALSFYQDLGYRSLSEDEFFVDLRWGNDL